MERNTTNVEHRLKSRFAIDIRERSISDRGYENGSKGMDDRSLRESDKSACTPDRLTSLTGSKVVRLIARNGEYKSAVEYTPRRRVGVATSLSLVSLFHVRRSPPRQSNITGWWMCFVLSEDRTTLTLHTLVFSSFYLPTVLLKFATLVSNLTWQSIKRTMLKNNWWKSVTIGEKSVTGVERKKKWIEMKEQLFLIKASLLRKSTLKGLNAYMIDPSAIRISVFVIIGCDRTIWMHHIRVLSVVIYSHIGR